MSDDQIAEIKARLDKLEACITPLQVDIAAIKVSVDDIKNNYNTTKMLIQYIIMPLVIILGALTGIKIAFPGL